MNKILICGFPHCGTTILKSIIGHIDDVEEIVDEIDKIDKTIDVEEGKYILCKYPFTLKKFFEKEYDDYIKIFIIRNPLFVFSSLNKRFSNKIPFGHSIDRYIQTVKLFITYRNNLPANTFLIRYEDLFENNYQNIRNILDSIGLKYTDKIFDNGKYINKIITGTELLNNKPENKDHERFRTWQINQPFVSNNDNTQIYLSKVQIKKIVNTNEIKEIYPNIRNAFPAFNI
jgi:hypothetical protein